MYARVSSRQAQQGDGAAMRKAAWITSSSDDTERPRCGQRSLAPAQFRLAQNKLRIIVLAFLARAVSGYVIMPSDGERWHILLNLIPNAIKFTLENGEKCVSASCCGEGLVIAVADTGIGMAPMKSQKRSNALDKSTVDSREKYEGTGLGLPLAQRLIELHGGNLKIESQVDAGTWQVHAGHQAQPRRQGPDDARQGRVRAPDDR